MPKKRKKLKITKSEIETVIFIFLLAVATNITTEPINLFFGGINIWVRFFIGLGLFGVLAFLFNLRR